LANGTTNSGPFHGSA